MEKYKNPKLMINIKYYTEKKSVKIIKRFADNVRVTGSLEPGRNQNKSEICKSKST